MISQLIPTVPEGSTVRIQVDHPMKAAAPSTTGAPLAIQQFVTNGWDTVFVVRLTDVNAAIVKEGTSPKSWDATVPASVFSAKLHGVGTFGAWALTTGGSGSIVRMQLPISSCTVTSGTTTIPVAGCVAYIQVKLNFLPKAPLAAATQATDHDLKVRTVSASQTDPVVIVDYVTYTTPAQDSGLDNVLRTLLQQWLNANLQDFNHVFASVNLNTFAASEDLQWMYPTYTSYAYIDNANIDNALLGVLCMVLNHSPVGAVQEISAGSIPGNSRGAFNISKELFLEKMVLPNLDVEFEKKDSTYFALSVDKTEIYSTMDIPLKAVRHGGINYYPVITAYTITIKGGEIQTYAYTHIPISPGIDAYSEMTYYNTLVLGTKADGTQSLTYKQTRDTDSKSWHTIASWVTGVEIAADIILAIASAAISGVTVAVERIVIRIVIAVVVGGVVATIAKVLESIPEWIAGAVPNEMPSIDPFIQATTKTIQWTGGKNFVLDKDGIRLNGALQLGGNPGFSS